MKSFKDWLKIREMVGTNAIVNKKYCNNQDFQIWGAVCKNEKQLKQQKVTMRK